MMCLGQWLKADLAAVDRSVTPWVFVGFHQPYVNSNTAHPIQTEGERTMPFYLIEQLENY